MYYPYFSYEDLNVHVLWKTVVALSTVKVVWLSTVIYLYTCV